jgi:hypothetical protein
VVLSIDEKTEMQALDPTPSGLPIKPGRCQAMTHDDKRHSTTTLFAAPSVLDGTGHRRRMPRQRHREFIRFLNAVEGFFAKLTRVPLLGLISRQRSIASSPRPTTIPSLLSGRPIPTASSVP